MSFSTDTKEELAALQVKKKCCQRAYAAGLLFDADTDGKGRALALYQSLHTAQAAQKATAAVFGSKAVEFPPVSEGKSYVLAVSSPDTAELVSDMGRYGVDAMVGFSCAECAGCFLRGLFIATGSLTSPERQYHLEFTLRNGERAEALSSFLSEYASPPAVRDRDGSVGLIYKSSAKIEDFLSSVGASQAYFSLLNGKIEREIRNDVNRSTNCMTKNIAKAVAASRAQTEALEALEKAGEYEKLPPELRETAQLRLLYPEMPLSELGTRHCPPISKSGVNHRMAKLMAIAEGIKKN